MPPPIRNPHVDIDTGHTGQSGRAGGCPGHAHASDDGGLTWQCAICELVTTHDWGVIDDIADGYLQAHGDGQLDAIPLPPCPGCGGVACLNHSDMVYGSDLPHHYTHRVVLEHLAERPALKGRFRVNHFEPHERFCGYDFSHLPAKDRPSWHRRVTAADHAEGARQARVQRLPIPGQRPRL